MTTRSGVHSGLRALLAIALLAGSVLSSPVTVQAPSEVERVAEDVVQAWKKQDSAALEELARKAWPRPWLVADLLWFREQEEAATSLARAAQDSIANPLQKYLGTLPVPLGPEFRDALERLHRAQSMRERDGALAHMESLGLAPSPVQLIHATCLAGELVRNHDLDASLAAYESAVVMARAVNWLGGEADALRGAGLTARRLPDGPNRALGYWSRASELSEQLGDELSMALNLFYIGNAHGESGRLRPALSALSRAHRVFQDRRDPRQVRVLLSLALVHARRGNPGKALDAYREVVRLTREDANPRLRAGTLLGMAEVQGQLGDIEASRASARDALRLFEHLKNQRGVARAHGVIGLSFEREGSYDDALSHLRSAFSAFEAIDDTTQTTVALTNLALLEMHSGQLREAEEHQRRALELAVEGADLWLQANAHFHLGRILCRAGRYDEARESDETLLRIGSELESARLLMRGHLNTANRLLDQGHYEEAIVAARRATAYTERFVTGLVLEEDARARDHRAEVYEIGQRAALGAGNPAALLQMLEEGRTRALVNSLGGRESLSEIELPPDLIARRERAEEAERESLRAWRTIGQDDPEASKEARRTLEEAREELREIDAEIESQDSVFIKPPSMKELRRTLDSDEALIFYLLLDPAATALVITAEEARIVPIGSSAEIADLCEELHATVRVARGVPVEASKASDAEPARIEALRELLLIPLELPKEVKRLLVSPDGPLARVPFVLVAPDHEVVYVPSGTTYHLLEERHEERGEDVLALGDPDYTERGDIASLPGTRAEARAIGDRTILGEDATEETLITELQREKPWRSVHLACHGFVDLAEPRESELALTPSDGSDGRLTVLEVFELPLRTDLVVLSACQTGVGKIYGAEGVFGFTRAFMSAGAPRVVVSLWRVDDEATQALMVRLYELWNPKDSEGLPLATALKQAQEYVRSQPRWQAPAYWAAWQLWGLPE